MGAREQELLAEALRSYIVERAPLPVRGGAFSLDALLPDQDSMSLQMGLGRPLRRYIDGTAKMEQPFSIFYRAGVTGGNDCKSAMMGVLNGIGGWMRENGPPYLGDWLDVSVFEQAQLAAVADREDRFITYMAGYRLGYTTK